MTNDQLAPEPHNDPDQSKMVQLYAMFTAGFVTSFIPHEVPQILGFSLLLVAMIWAYILRAKSDEGSLAQNHTTYVIRTIWIGTLFLNIGIVGAAMLGDHSVIYNLMNDMMRGMMPTEAQIKALMGDYIYDNRFIFPLTLGPSLIYMVYRIGHGLMRISKGYRMANPKAWF